MADVFFSYKREDRSAVERLVRLLEAEGISVWWDPSIVPGERYAAVIRRALNEAVCVVVAWSHQSIDSLWVQDEAGIGRDRGVLVPISLDGIEPPLGFRQLQTANLADWNGRPDDPRILHFLAGVRRLVSASARSAPPAVATAPVGNIARPLVRAGPEAATTVADSNPLATKPSVSWRKIAIVVACTLAAALLTAGALTLGPQRKSAPGSTAIIASLPTPVVRQFNDCGGCPVMIVVPTGSFQMGSPEREPQRGSDEGPQHEVTFTKPFVVGKYPVTVEEWNVCVKHRECTDWPSVAKFGGGSQPAVNVSWDDARAYVTWLSRVSGQPYRLLTEAEREYITRAGTSTAFWWGSSISTKLANYDGTQRYTDEQLGDFRKRTWPVDAFAPNPWGFYDVHGNSWNWVEDCYHDSYEGAPTNGSAWTTGDCNRRVLRGGSWESQPRNLRSAARWRLGPVDRGDWYGFRVARACDPVKCSR